MTYVAGVKHFGPRHEKVLADPEHCGVDMGLYYLMNWEVVASLIFFLSPHQMGRPRIAAVIIITIAVHVRNFIYLSNSETVGGEKQIRSHFKGVWMGVNSNVRRLVSKLVPITWDSIRGYAKW